MISNSDTMVCPPVHVIICLKSDMYCLLRVLIYEKLCLSIKIENDIALNCEGMCVLEI